MNQAVGCFDHNMPFKLKPGSAVRENFKKIVSPAIDGRTPYAANTLESLQGSVRIITLTKGGEQQYYRCPINPAPPESDRWRKDTTTTTFTAAAKAVTNLELFCYTNRAAPRFTQIIGKVQRASTIGQRLFFTCFAKSKSI